MRRLAALGLVVALFGCIPTPPPKPAPLPVAQPYVTQFGVVCVDRLGGIHYVYTASATGIWGFQYFLPTVGWSTSQQLYPRKFGDQGSVTTNLAFRLVYYKVRPDGTFEPIRVASPVVTPRPISKAC